MTKEEIASGSNFRNLLWGITVKYRKFHVLTPPCEKGVSGGGGDKNVSLKSH
jgi:hypothetical protein